MTNLRYNHHHLFLKIMLLTGDGQGDVLADDKDFSLSSGSSTELILIFRAESNRLL